MKNNLILILLFIVPINMQAQDNNGIVNYKITSISSPFSKKGENLSEEKTKKFDGIFKKVMKEIEKITLTLQFKNGEAVCSKAPMVTTESNKYAELAKKTYSSVYYNAVTTRLEQREQMGQLLLVSKPVLDWKVTTETKKIGQYVCTKAIAEEIINTAGKKRILTAWYTTEIPVPFGPLDYGGLPGLIIELNNGYNMFSATKITIGPKTKVVVKKPKKGKKITEQKLQEESAKMRERWMKEMR